MSTYKVLTIPGSSHEVERYMGLILSNWLTTQKYTNDWFKLIDEKVYYAVYPKVIRAILQRPNCKVNLAVLSDDEDVCVGFSVYEEKKLHYCFVRRSGRKQKIARSLVPFEFDVITHLTVPGVVIWKKKFPNVTFNPFI